MWVSVGTCMCVGMCGGYVWVSVGGCGCGY